MTIALSTVSCGVETASTRAEATAASSPFISATASPAPQTQVAQPTAEELNRLKGAGVVPVGEPTKPNALEVSYETAVTAALASNGGLMKDGLTPSAAWFGDVRTPDHGTVVGTGADEQVAPQLDASHAWLLVYRDVRVPSSGGRGPQESPSESPAETSSDELAAVVSLVVVVDGVTGNFLFARSL